MMRHLLYFVCPIAGNGVWQWNCEQLRPHLDLFNGKRIVAIATGQMKRPRMRAARLDDPEAVQSALPGCQYLTFTNNPNLGEAVAWDTLWAQLPRDGVTFYAHAKGVRHGEKGQYGVNVRKWAHAMYRTCLNWPAVESQLKTHLLCGTFKKIGYNLFPTLPSSKWHYSGSFYWVRNAEWFARGGHRGFQDRMTSEAMPGMIYKPEEAGALLASELAHKMDMYQDATWRSWADRAVEQWLADRVLVA